MGTKERKNEKGHKRKGEKWRERKRRVSGARREDGNRYEKGMDMEMERNDI